MTLPETTLKAIDLQLRLERKIAVKNKTTSFSFNISKSYISGIFANKFRLANKNAKCELNIYLNLANMETNSALFHEDRNLKVLIEDPFWINYKLNIKQKEWRKDFLNSITKYSLLICHSSEDKTCNTYKSNWISTTLFESAVVRLKENILFLAMSPSQNSLFVLCPYCDPCTPFQFIWIGSSKLFDLNELLVNNMNIMKLYTTNPYSTDIVLAWYV